MTKENGLSDTITEHMVEIIKNYSLFKRISNLENRANKTIYGVGSFCLVVTLFSIMNYNKTKFIIQFIQKQLTNISDSCYHKNKNIDKISEKVNDIEDNIDKMTHDIYDIKMEFNNLSSILNLHLCNGKKGIEKSTSIDPFEFLSLEDICGENYRENYEEKGTQTEESPQMGDVIVLKPNELEYHTKNDQDDIMNECYDIIPCNNIKKYVNNKYSLFF